MNKQMMIAMLAASSCSATQYKTYGISADAQGIVQKYLAAEEKDDLDVKACAPRPGNQFPCRMLEVDEYGKILRDMLELQEQLKACQSADKP